MTSIRQRFPWPFQWLTQSRHSSVEQKLVVNTPSCATNVSDHSSVGLLNEHIPWKLCLSDLPHTTELLLRLDCATDPTTSAFVLTGKEDLLLAVPLNLGISVWFVLAAEQANGSEFLSLFHANSVLHFFSMAFKNVEKLVPSKKRKFEFSSFSFISTDCDIDLALAWRLLLDCCLFRIYRLQIK